ncbi:hypothetical protein [Peijinzhouia sedimentorum]
MLEKKSSAVLFDMATGSYLNSKRGDNFDMKYFIKIITILAMVLGILSISLLVVAFLVWDINSKDVTEIVEESSKSALSSANIGSYLSVLTGIVAFLFPVSLSIISDAKGKYFSSQEVTTIVFNQRGYFGLKVILGILILTTFASFWTPLPIWATIILLIVIIGSLGFLFYFFRQLEGIISDFSQLVREEEKSKINRLLKNG